MSDSLPVFPEPGHDHGACAAAALARAEARCAERGARLTPVRRQVLEIVWESHAPLGAYDILARMNAAARRTGGAREKAPPAVYRALKFLLDHGLVHRVESRNAYVGCGASGGPHAAWFFICERCNDAAEIDDGRIGGALRESARRAGFAIESSIVELRGRCPRCRDGRLRA